MKKLLYLTPFLSLLFIQSASALYIGIGADPEYRESRREYRHEEYPEYYSEYDDYLENIDGW